MRVPIEWLRDYVEIPGDKIESYADALTMAGLEVEEILNDPTGPVFVTKITPNRGDWASVSGTARELAAAEKIPLRSLPGADKSFASGQAGKVSIRVDDAEGCGRFQGIVIEGVKIGPAPEWIQARLRAALGDRYRPINNVADITNYVMLATGQPLHAFDLDTIPGGEIVVRSAKPGEKLVTLDGVERELPEGVLCICDREKPISIAGIMGGQPTEITERTTCVLLETAHFDPLRIRRGAKKTLRSEASYRFERYVDPELAKSAGEMAARLICELAGGTVVEVAEEIARPTPKVRVLARMDRIRKLLGADVDRDEAIGALERLGVEVTRSAGSMDCGIPSWRPDLTIEDDIAEEVGRLALGYANLPERVSWQIGGRGQDSPKGVFLAQVRDALARAGMQEVVTHSLVSPDAVAEDALALRNPMAPEYSRLRDSLLPNLLAVAARANREGIRDLSLFEVGPVYRKSGEAGIVEPLRVAGLVSGSDLGGVWAAKPESYPADFHYARGIVDALLFALGIDGLEVRSAPHPLLHAYRAAELSVRGKVLGILGELSGETVDREGVPARACVFDLDGDLLRALAADRSARIGALPRFPAAVRDLAPVFDAAVSWGEIEREIAGLSEPLLESFALTDFYAGAGLGAGRRALTIRLTLRSEEGTLTEARIEETVGTIRATLARLGGEFRS